MTNPTPEAVGELVERLVGRLVEQYRARPVQIAEAFDEQIDRSGNALGWLREIAALERPHSKEQGK